MALFVDLVALSNGLHGSVQMDSVALFSWIGWLRHHGILNGDVLDVVAGTNTGETVMDFKLSTTTDTAEKAGTYTGTITYASSVVDAQ